MYLALLFGSTPCGFSGALLIRPGSVDLPTIYAFRVNARHRQLMNASSFLLRHEGKPEHHSLFPGHIESENLVLLFCRSPDILTLDGWRRMKSRAGGLGCIKTASFLDLATIYRDGSSTCFGTEEQQHVRLTLGES